MNLVPIRNLADPPHRELACYANMRDAELAQRADALDEAAHGGVFIAEGELVVRRLVRSRFRTQSVLTTPARLEAIGDALDGLPAETPIYLAEQKVLNDIVGFNMHRGLLAIGERGTAPEMEELLRRPGPVVVLEDLTNHDNLGGVFRNAAALGGLGVWVLLSPRCADPLYRKSLRVSMGLALSVPYVRAAAWPGALGELRRAGFETWGLTPREGSLGLAETVAGCAAGKRVALVVGSEGPGMTDEALAVCGRAVRIEMAKVDGAVDSLNVAMAAGIALYALGLGRCTEG